MPGACVLEEQILENLIVRNTAECDTADLCRPVRMTGSSGWKQTADTLWLWPSRVWTQALVW